jgi:hypothetical protein
LKTNSAFFRGWLGCGGHDGGGILMPRRDTVQRSMPPRSELIVRTSVLAVQLAGVLLIGRLTSVDAGFPIDDAWIHQTAARNLVENGTLGVVPGHFGSGTTSLLWVGLLAINHLWLHWSPSTYSTLLGVALLIFAGQVVLHCARRDGWSPSRAGLFAALFTVSPNHAWFALSGMEVCLGTALLVCAIGLWFAETRTRASAVATGAVMSLLVLTRPESCVLCFGVLVLAPWAHRKLGHVIVASVLPVLAFILYLSVNLSGQGQAGPSTLAGRRWMWLQEMANWPWYAQRFSLISRLLDRIWEFTLGEPWLVVFWFLVGLAGYGAVWCWVGAKRIGALVVLGALQLGTYLIMLPAEGHGGRYEPLVFALFLPLACEGACRCFSLLTSIVARLRKWMTVTTWLVPAALLPGLLSAFGAWASAHALAVVHVNATEVAAGHWVSQLPPGTRIASFDIGGIGYFGRRPLLDIGGLSDPSVISDVIGGRIAQRLKRERIEYVILPMGYSDYFPDPWNFKSRLGLSGARGLSMSIVRQFISPSEVWVPGLRATLHCSPRQVVYRIDANHGDP